MRKRMTIYLHCRRIQNNDKVDDIMAWNRKQPISLCIIIFTLCILLAIDMIHVLVNGNEIIFFIMTVAPLFGMYTGVAFLRKDKDGFGGIIFHLFMLYCAIYYLVLSIVDIATVASNVWNIFYMILNMATTGLGWLGLFMYYD